jgi:hydroxysqualene dehydroxylase
LGESFVTPALTTLARTGAEVSFGQRLRSLGTVGDAVRSLAFSEGTLDLAAGDAVVLAVPPWVAADLVPGLEVPDQHRAIVNGHFRLPAPHPGAAFLGLLGGMSQWLFVRGEVASITVSAADALADRPAEELASEMWREVRAALDLGEAPLRAHRLLKEKWATIAQTPEQLRRRPPAATRWRNLVLAGDWTDTGLPATIEGAVRSGRRAARVLAAPSH